MKQFMWWYWNLLKGAFVDDGAPRPFYQKELIKAGKLLLAQLLFVLVLFVFIMGLFLAVEVVKLCLS